MKKILLIALILSLCLNGYFVWQEIRYRQILELGKLSHASGDPDGNQSSWPEGLAQLKKTLFQKHPSFQNKKRFYINIWTNWCKPCIREMPWLDTLANKLPNDWAFVFVSDMSDETAGKILQKFRPPLKNFVALNNCGDFVEAVCRQQKIHFKTYPMALVLNQDGQVLHFSVGAYNSALEARNFLEVCQQVPQH